jgi:hypothetical protein
MAKKFYGVTVRPYQVGDAFTTLNSNVTGIIKDIVPNKKSGSTRILLDVNGKDRWTTYKLGV